MNNVDEKIKTSDKFRMIFIVLLLLLIVVPLLFISYDKFINNEKPPEKTATPEVTDNINDNKITNFERVTITNTDTVVKIDNKEFKIREEITVDGAYLLIDDNAIVLNEMETVYANFAYVTNKYIIFTLIGQDGELISYAIDKEGKQIIVDDSKYQMHDITLSDDNLIASGHIFCGLDGDCPDKELLIKYDNDKIIVIPNE